MLPSAKTALLTGLVALGITFLARWIAFERAAADGRVILPTWRHIGLGLVTNFFDTLGIGSFATTASLFKITSTVDDGDIPGTLNVGHTVPTLAEAFIYIAVVRVEMLTLATMIAGAVLGAWIGSGVVTRLSKHHIQWGVGFLLVVAAVVMVVRLCHLIPSGSEAIAIKGNRLVIGVVFNALLGALMMLGIGLYAPCMILVSLLGMSVTTAFPIMMGSCAFLMPIASPRFVSARRYDLRAALGLAVGGVPGVLIAAFIVRSLPLLAMQWMVVVVVLISAVAMLRSAAQSGLANECCRSNNQ